MRMDFTPAPRRIYRIRSLVIGGTIPNHSVRRGERALVDHRCPTTVRSYQEPFPTPYFDPLFR
jgi:hypothetical protein